MPVRSSIRRWFIGVAVIAAVVALASATSRSATPAEARLVAFEPMANFGAGETCEWESATPQFPSYASYAPAGAAAQMPPANARLAVAKRPPVTFIQDPYPNYSSIAVDPVRN